MTPTVQAGCEDCDTTTNHRTRTDAVAAIREHVMATMHWPLIADNNGWHRIWLDWADYPWDMLLPDTTCAKG